MVAPHELPWASEMKIDETFSVVAPIPVQVLPETDKKQVLVQNVSLHEASTSPDLSMVMSCAPDQLIMTPLC